MKDNKEKEIIEVQKVEKSKTEKNKTENNTKAAKEQENRKKGLCIASMVLGIITLVLFCVWYISIPCGILAIIFGALGVKTIDKGMAIAGIVTGAIGLFISFCIAMTLFIFVFVIGITESLDDMGYEYHRSYFDDYDYE